VRVNSVAENEKNGTRRRSRQSTQNRAITKKSSRRNESGNGTGNQKYQERPYGAQNWCLINHGAAGNTRKNTGDQDNHPTKYSETIWPGG
jgi:hypothetical protein